VGAERLKPTDPLFSGLFAGALVLFLIELGVIAAQRLRDITGAGVRVVLLAVAIPVVNGALGAVAGSLAGLSTGGVAIMSTLAASASYIALPQASPGLYVTASLGVTFPFNITLGIPLYIELAQLLS